MFIRCPDKFSITVYDNTNLENPPINLSTITTFVKAKFEEITPAIMFLTINDQHNFWIFNLESDRDIVFKALLKYHAKELYLE